MIHITSQQFIERALDKVREAQSWASDYYDSDEEEARWCAALKVDGASVEDNALVVRFIEPDGRCINYRWVVYDPTDNYSAFDDPEESIQALGRNLWEDVLTSERIEVEGVRWFGDLD